jgi:hypothetical protein
MTIDLENGNQVSFNAFRDHGWLKVQSCGGGLLVKMSLDDAEAFGLAVWQEVRKVKRLSR